MPAPAFVPAPSSHVHLALLVRSISRLLCPSLRALYFQICFVRRVVCRRVSARTRLRGWESEIAGLARELSLLHVRVCECLTLSVSIHLPPPSSSLPAQPPPPPQVSNPPPFIVRRRHASFAALAAVSLPAASSLKPITAAIVCRHRVFHRPTRHVLPLPLPLFLPPPPPPLPRSTLQTPPLMFYHIEPRHVPADTALLPSSPLSLPPPPPHPLDQHSTSRRRRQSSRWHHNRCRDHHCRLHDCHVLPSHVLPLPPPPPSPIMLPLFVSTSPRD